jgi:hypothetical protein
MTAHIHSTTCWLRSTSGRNRVGFWKISSLARSEKNLPRVGQSPDDPSTPRHPLHRHLSNTRCEATARSLYGAIGIQIRRKETEKRRDGVADGDAESITDRWWGGKFAHGSTSTARKKAKNETKKSRTKSGRVRSVGKTKNPLSINKDFRWKFIGPSAGSNRWRRVYFWCYDVKAILRLSQ